MRAGFLLSLSLLAGPALAEVPKVVTDTPVTASLVQQVMGDLGQPVLLMDAGTDPHHVQLRPSQMRAMQDADLLVWIGPEMSPWLAQAAARKGKWQLPLIATGREQRRYDDHPEEEGHHHDHTHLADPKAEPAATANPYLDPHGWLNPKNGADWLASIASRLGEKDPEHAAIYVANAARAQQDLAARDAALRDLLAPAKGKHFVTFHDAYGYFTDYYGLEPAIAISLGDGSAPSAARLREIQSRITDSGAVCAFPEVNQPAGLIEELTEGGTLRIGKALSPEGQDLEPGPALYGQILDRLGQRIAACLEGTDNN
ncbi:MAG: zinc ABC transporter substrate-binding protein [Paracoccus sp. (in: a-proteobacteria)]